MCRFPQLGEKAMRDEPKLDRILNDVAARALQATGATGVAIGLGREDAMICYAATGLPFADLGVRINTESGLTAAAIRRQMSQWCSDTESDSRVDIEVCRQLGARSIIVSPVSVQDSVVGVFAIFSPNPDALSLADLNAVKKLSHWVSEAVRYTVRKPSALTVPPAIVDREVSNPPPLSLFVSGRPPEAGLGNYLARVWRALARALSGAHNGRTGQG